MKYAKPGAYIHGMRPPRTIVGTEVRSTVTKYNALKGEAERWMITVRGIKAYEVRRFREHLRMMPMDRTSSSWRTDGHIVDTIGEARELAKRLHHIPA